MCGLSIQPCNIYFLYSSLIPITNSISEYDLSIEIILHPSLSIITSVAIGSLSINSLICSIFIFSSTQSSVANCVCKQNPNSIICSILKSVTGSLKASSCHTVISSFKSHFNHFPVEVFPIQTSASVNFVCSKEILSKAPHLESVNSCQ